MPTRREILKAILPAAAIVGGVTLPAVMTMGGIPQPGDPHPECPDEFSMDVVEKMVLTGGALIQKTRKLTYAKGRLVSVSAQFDVVIDTYADACP